MSPETGRIRNKIGRARPKVVEIAPRIGRNPSQMDRTLSQTGSIRSKIGRDHPKLAESRPDLVEIATLVAAFARSSPKSHEIWLSSLGIGRDRSNIGLDPRIYRVEVTGQPRISTLKKRVPTTCFVGGNSSRLSAEGRKGNTKPAGSLAHQPPPGTLGRSPSPPGPTQAPCLIRFA